MEYQMHKRKPLVIIDTFHLLTAFTGIKTYTSILCEHTIGRDDLKATYISIPFWKRADNSTFLKGKLNFLQKIISHSGFIIWKLGVLPLVLLFKRADAVIAPDYVLPIRFNKCLGLTVFHDTLYWEYKENYNRLWRWYYTKMAEKLLGKYS
ncbi:MAG TPA: hypothetical protein PKC24_12520, partial [Cyclobacteriaceae bacterium]|nr:hypothetical protein [Cyclobacteriaceae bacterium]